MKRSELGKSEARTAGVAAAAASGGGGSGRRALRTDTRLRWPFGTHPMLLRHTRAASSTGTASGRPAPAAGIFGLAALASRTHAITACLELSTMSVKARFVAAPCRHCAQCLPFEPPPGLGSPHRMYSGCTPLAAQPAASSQKAGTELRGSASCAPAPPLSSSCCTKTQWKHRLIALLRWAEPLHRSGGCGGARRRRSQVAARERAPPA